MKGVSAIALAVQRIFRQQKAQAVRDKLKFGDWNWKLADALGGAVAELYLAAARSARMKAEHAGDFAALARIRAVEVAREINAVTGQWLGEGRDLEEVFGDTRVVRIASTEAVYARNAGILQVAGGRGQRVVWRNRRSPCDACRQWNGRRVKAGKAFGVVDGVMVFHPPRHVNCFCVLEVE